jgi:ATP-dependent exoDNAse (exonuclease V) beta subunit
MTLLEKDTEARADSLDITRSLIVQAPAGSGKTTLLIQRYLRLLASVDEPESILAMTFTRKAAGEMLARVEQALAQAALPESSWPDDPSKRQTIVLAHAALQHAQACGWQLSETPGRLRIQTIDGVHRSLAAAVPISAGGAGQLALAAQPMLLYREVARRSLREAELDPEWASISGRLFDHLDNAWVRVEDLLAKMLAQRARWLPHLVGRRFEELSEELSQGIAKVLRQLQAQLEQTFESGARRQIVELARHAKTTLDAAGGDADLRRQLQAIADAEEGVANDALVPDIECWRAIAHLVLTKKDQSGAIQFRRRVDIRQGFGPKDPKKKMFEQWLTDWSSPERATLLDEARQAPPVCFDADERELMQALVRLLLLAASQLELAFRERGEVDFIGVAAAAREVLREVGDLDRERILHQGSRLQHLLIDEFQDTSRDQFELILGLTRDWQSGDGRTLFVVGDPMQSIYQFREARVDLFEAALRDGFGDVKLAPRSLARNFRSVPAIVEHVNQLFTVVFPKVVEPRESAVPFAASLAGRDGSRIQRDASGAVPAIDWRLAAMVGDDAQSQRWETEAVVDCVRRWRADASVDSIAILVAARHHATALVAALRAAGYPVRGVDLVPLAETSVVQDLLALTRALASVLDRLAWLTILRAPWCGMSLVDLTALLADQPHAAITELWESEERLARLSPEGRSRVHHLRSCVAPMLVRSDLSLSARVEAVWLQLHAPACYEDEGAIDDARRYFDALAEASLRPGWRAAVDLSAMLEGLYAAGSTVTGAIEVMTIHRSKGLEFDAVIVPGLSRRVQSDPRELLELVEWQEGEQSLALFGPIEASDAVAGRPSVAAWIRRLRSRRIDRERARLLYVAMTRAKRYLAPIACFTVKKDGEASIPARSPLGVLRPAMVERIERALREPLMPIELDSAVLAPMGFRRWPVDFEAPVWPENLTVSTLNLSSTELDAEPERMIAQSGDPHARALGIVIHRELERLARQAQLPFEIDASAMLRWRQGLLLEGVPRERCDWYLERVRAAVQRTLQDERGRWILARRDERDGIELALTGKVAGRIVNVVIDRCFVEAGQRWVIDYKTSIPSDDNLSGFLDAQREAHRAQLERYSNLLARFGPEPVRAALYFPTLTQFVELN